MTPKARVYAYLATTTLFALAMAGSGLFDLSRAPALLQTLAHLGYPAHLATLLGIWKLLGVAAIVSPGRPRLKEWAFAGFSFDLSGAAYSHALSGDPVAVVATPLVLLALGLAAYGLRPRS